MFKKKTKSEKKLVFDTDIFCLLLRKSAGYLQKKFNSDAGRRSIIAAKCQLSRCTTTYMMLKSFTCIDDEERWENLRSKFVYVPIMNYENVHYFLDTKNNITVRVDSDYERISPFRYKSSSISLEVNGVSIDSKADKIVSMIVFDTMAKIRKSIIALEKEQYKQKQLHHLKSAYDKDL